MKKAMVMLVFLCVSFVLFASLSVAEKDFLVTHGMRNTSFYGDFVQTKGLKNSERVLRSYGVVEVNPDKGIVWSTEKPYKSVVVITSRYIAQKIRNNEPVRTDMSGNYIYTLISSSIRSVFFADFGLMEECFTAELSRFGERDNKGSDFSGDRSEELKNPKEMKKAEELKNSEDPYASGQGRMGSLLNGGSSDSHTGSEDGWTLSLIPKDDVLSQFVERIYVSGKTDIESVRLVESSGDYILYEFKNLNEGEVISSDVWKM